MMQSNMTFHFGIRYPLSLFTVCIKTNFLLEAVGHCGLTDLDNGIENENSGLERILKNFFILSR